jgi:hypothetical protein
MQYLYNDLTEKIIVAYYRVYDFYRAHPGYEENNLRDALKIEMENMGLQVSAEVPVGRAYEGRPVGNGLISYRNGW